MNIPTILLGIILILAGMGLIGLNRVLGSIVGLIGFIVLMGGIMHTKIAIDLDSTTFQNAVKEGRRDPDKKNRFTWEPVQGEGITFEYPSYLTERLHWGSLREIMAPILLVSSDSTLATFRDPVFRSLFISVDLLKGKFRYLPSLSNRPNYSKETLEIDGREATVQRATEEGPTMKIHIDMLSFSTPAGLFLIKGYSLTEDYAFNRPLIDSLFRSVSGAPGIF